MLGSEPSLNAYLHSKTAATGIGVIGAGYWGPKHVRSFSELAQARVVMVADLDQHRLAAIRCRHPEIYTTTAYQDLLASSEVQAVIVATPASTHVELARQALAADKHVLVEKPLATSSVEVEDLIRLAQLRGRVLMVGHTFLYNPAVRMLRDLVQCGELGDVYYAHAQRLNLGVFQRDINVLWDLAPHDISILMYVLGVDPVAVGARGNAYVRVGIEDVAYLDLVFPGRVRAQVHLSWLDPNKVRRLTIVGSRKMAVYDDVDTLEKIRIYDKGVDAPPQTASFGEFQLSYRYGGISIPHVASAEPLRLECEHFLDCICTGRTPLTDGQHGLAVVRTIEGAQASLQDGCLKFLAAGMGASQNGECRLDARVTHADTIEALA